MADGGKDDTDSYFKASPNAIPHNPRKRASGPGFNPKDLQLVDEGLKPAPQAVPAASAAPGPSLSEPAAAAASMIRIHEGRYGSEVIKYGSYKRGNVV